MEKKSSKQCIHGLKECAMCRIYVRPPKSDKPPKKELRRYTPIRQKSPQQEEYDCLHRLLKHARLLRDGPRCIGPFTTHHPLLDCSHIFPKSVYFPIRFVLDNCVLQCRTCHEWFGDHPEKAGTGYAP